MSEARCSGIQEGYPDGLAGRRRRPKPSLTLSLAFPSYMRAFLSGYAEGYAQGDLDRRRAALARLRKTRNAKALNHERER